MWKAFVAIEMILTLIASEDLVLSLSTTSISAARLEKVI